MEFLNTVNKKVSKGFAILFFVFLVASCLSQEAAQDRLTPPKSTKDFRIEKIEKAVEEDPANAIHLIGMYEIVYSKTLDDKDSEEKIKKLKNTAIENLKAKQIKAVEEKRWDVASSLERSLFALGIEIDYSTKESNFLLQEAKEYLENNKNLQAFLTAAKSNEIKMLSGLDALLFLERAVQTGRRNTAAYFLAIADKIGTSVPSEMRAFAQGRDNPTEMIKGAATLLIDRGIKIEKGKGFKDTVLGSAFFVDDSGLMITNYHVIESEVDPEYEGYSKMFIRMGDASSALAPAKVIGWDKAMDLALIKTEVKPEYIFSVVDRTAAAKIGDSVLAIGSPAGLEKTVTMGIVSALGRRFLQLGDVIQIDAAVNHGNSGGPVVDSQGRLVGVVFAGTDTFQGLNFAIPAERLIDALPAMLKGGKAERPWLGLSLAETRDGAEIIYVAPLTPAADQRVESGVYISSIGGKTVKAPQGMLIPALQDCLFSCRPGELVALETSDGARRVLQLQVRPAVPLANAAKIDSRERLAAPLFGIVLETSGGKTSAPAYLVKKVLRGSVADEAGISAKDPVAIQGFRVEEKDGYAILDINVKRKTSGFFETSMRLPAALNTPDTL
ncbi:MAG: S1C family serine protease [Termitinemataceae bacterium]|nr:MAG: S1C family serine protease [Termitinemataceae bacterium]